MIIKSQLKTPIKNHIIHYLLFYIHKKMNIQKDNEIKKNIAKY